MTERHFGVTGSRSFPFHREQRETARGIMKRLLEEGFLWQHNGLCIGADDWMGETWQALGGKLYGHPGHDDKGECHTRCSLTPDLVVQERPFLVRNVDIVVAGETLLAMPSTDRESTRSGTWHAVRAGRRFNKGLHIILPNGSVRTS